MKYGHWIVGVLLLGCGGSAGYGASGAGGSAGYGGSAGSAGVVAGGAGGSAGVAGVVSVDGGTAGNPATGIQAVITASAARVCPGQCVDLTAQAEHGVAPYLYSWDHGLGEGPGPHSICPSETTTVSVTVSDASFDDEFMDRNVPVTASTQITLRSEEECSDGGVTPIGTRELCSLRMVAHQDSWVSSAGFQEGDELFADGDGNLVIAGQFYGTIDIGEVTLSSTATNGHGFVAKVDSDCHLVWIKRFGELAAAHVWLGAVSGDDQDNIFVGGQFQGSVDFGAGLVTTGFNVSSGVLMKLDPQGTVLWSRTFASVFNSVAVTGVEVDSQNRINFGGYAAADTSFGGVALGGLQAGNIPYLAQLDSAGAHRWSKPISSADIYASLDVGHDDSIVVIGWANNGVDFGSGPFLLPMSGSRYMAKLNAAGAQQWVRALPTPDPDQWGWWNQGAAIDGRGDILTVRSNAQLEADGSVRFYGETIEKYSAAGADIWERTLGAASYDNGDYNAVHADGSNAVLHLSSFAGDATYEGDAITARGETDLLLIKLTPEGEPVWHTVFGGGSYDWGLGVTTDAQRNVFVAYSSMQSSDHTEADLVIAKLTP